MGAINPDEFSRVESSESSRAQNYLLTISRIRIASRNTSNFHTILTLICGAASSPLRWKNLAYRLLYRVWDETIGGIREDFFVETMLMNEYTIHYLKSTRGKKIPDYLVDTGKDELVVEIGGKGKDREQFKGIDKKKSLIFTHSDVVEGIKRPLFLAGYL